VLLYLRAAVAMLAPPSSADRRQRLRLRLKKSLSRRSSRHTSNHGDQCRSDSVPGLRGLRELAYARGRLAHQ